MKKEFTIIIEQDEDGIYVASVPQLEGFDKSLGKHHRGRSLCRPFHWRDCECGKTVWGDTNDVFNSCGSGIDCLVHGFIIY